MKFISGIEFKWAHLLSNFTLIFRIVIFVVIGFFGLGANSINQNQYLGNEGEIKPDAIRISIGAIGEIMAYETQLMAQKTDSGTWDFNNNYLRKDGWLVQIDLLKPPGGKTNIESIQHFPLWVNRSRQNNKFSFEVLNCLDYLEKPNDEEALKLPEATLNRISNSYKRTKKLLKKTQ